MQNSWLFPFQHMDVAAWLDSIGSPRLTDMKDFATWIEQAAEQHDLNPRWLLTLAQKEQSFITRPAGGTGWQRALQYTMGYGALDSGTDLPQFVGTERQIFSAAGGLRGYLTPGSRFDVHPLVGRPFKTFDEGDYTPTNLAEAAALRYTPRMSGLRLHSRIYERWFTQEAQPMTPTITKADLADLAERVVAARQAGRREITINRITFKLEEGGMCSRFVRQAQEAVLNLPEWSLSFGRGRHMACCASATEVNMVGMGYKRSTSERGDIVCFNNPAAGGTCKTCGRVVGHIGINLGGGLVAENTSASRGNPRPPGTKITALQTIGASRVSGYYSYLPGKTVAAPQQPLIVQTRGGDVIDCNPALEDGKVRVDIRPMLEYYGIGVYGQHLGNLNKVFVDDRKDE